MYFVNRYIILKQTMYTIMQIRYNDQEPMDFEDVKRLYGRKK